MQLKRLMLMRKIILNQIRESLMKKLPYQYFSTTHNKACKLNYHLTLLNFLMRLLKYFPLSSKFLKLSKEAAAGLKRIVW